MTEPIQQIQRGIEELISENELKAKLAKGKPLRIKLGVDPTAPDLHLGHFVALRKLKTFQDLGHQIVFLVGDFTATIGDPSGRNATRPPLSDEEIKAHAKTYTDQVFRVLDREKTEVRYNSEWLNALGAKGLIKLCGHTTLARITERDDFEKRIKEDASISLHELLYPLMQGYDSVALKADVEIGGTDQKFNLLMGRNLQKDYGQEQQVVLTLPLLEGLDGVRKMSKSYGNYVAFNDTPKDKFGKLMSIPDALMPKYVTLLTDLDVKVLEAMHPRDAKALLARTITAFFDGEAAAKEAEAEFSRVFSKQEVPADLETHCASKNPIGLSDLLVEAKLVDSKNEARRLIEQGGVKIGGKKIEKDGPVTLQGETVLQAGKRRFKKITI